MTDAVATVNKGAPFDSSARLDAREQKSSKSSAQTHPPKRVFLGKNMSESIVPIVKSANFKKKVILTFVSAVEANS